jgi:hypothetical protein
MYTLTLRILHVWQPFLDFLCDNTLNLTGVFSIMFK